MSNPKYNESIAGLYKTNSGNFLSMKVDARTLAQLQKVEIGSKLLFRVFTGQKKTRTFPDAFIEIQSKESVAEFDAKREAEREARNEAQSDSSEGL